MVVAGEGKQAGTAAQWCGSGSAKMVAAGENGGSWRIW